MNAIILPTADPFVFPMDNIKPDDTDTSLDGIESFKEIGCCTGISGIGSTGSFSFSFGSGRIGLISFTTTFSSSSSSSSTSSSSSSSSSSI
jgi:hypothetical protein